MCVCVCVCVCVCCVCVCVGSLYQDPGLVWFVIIVCLFATVCHGLPFEIFFVFVKSRHGLPFEIFLFL